MKKGKKGCMISDVIFVCIFGCILSVIVARAAWYFGEVQLKSDNALTTENLVRVVSIRLEAYKEETRDLSAPAGYEVPAGNAGDPEERFPEDFFL